MRLLDQMLSMVGLARKDRALIASMTPEELAKAMELLAKEQATIKPVEGNGDGAFLPDMTEDEYREYLRDETHGWKGFYNRVTGRTPTETDG